MPFDRSLYHVRTELPLLRLLFHSDAPPRFVRATTGLYFGNLAFGASQLVRNNFRRDAVAVVLMVLLPA